MRRTPQQRQTEITRLRKARCEALQRLEKLPNLVGSMIGLKFRSNVRTNGLGLTLFVSEKVPESEIAPRHRIPRTIKTSAGILKTDVLVWRSMVEQSLQQSSLMYDGSQQGTLTCFGLRDDRAFGVSCAHCLAGIDRNPATPTNVDMWDEQNRQWLKAGKSLYSVYSAGPGEIGNFGYIDCGIFSLRDDDLILRAKSAQRLQTVTNLYDLFDQQLTGRSSLNPQGANDPIRHAYVIGIEQETVDGNCDVVLEVVKPGTFKGDSGMLWFTSDGKAAAIHTRGDNAPHGQGSLYVTAMSAARAAGYLQISLAYG